MANINFIAQLESTLLDHEITCGNCKQGITRRICKAEPAQYVAGMVFTNYFCPECGSVVRCDSAFVQPMIDETTGDNSNE